MSEEISREDLFDQNRNEAHTYANALPEELIKLPLTRLGFEGLLEAVSRLYSLPADDASRAVLAGYIHHIPNEQNETTLQILGRVLHKSVANSTSWRIDQEIKEKRRKAFEAKESPLKEGESACGG